MATKRPSMRRFPVGSNPYNIRHQLVHNTEKAFRQVYQIGNEQENPGEFGKKYRVRRKSDKKILIANIIPKAIFTKLHDSLLMQKALQIDILFALTIPVRNKHI